MGCRLCMGFQRNCSGNYSLHIAALNQWMEPTNPTGQNLRPKLAVGQGADTGESASQVILPEQMQKGFLALVQSVDDLRMDVPEAPQLIATFVARAVVDDILPPAFVDKLPSGRDNRSLEGKLGVAH